MSGFFCGYEIMKNENRSNSLKYQGFRVISDNEMNALTADWTPRRSVESDAMHGLNDISSAVDVNDIGTDVLDDEQTHNQALLESWQEANQTTTSGGDTIPASWDRKLLAKPNSMRVYPNRKLWRGRSKKGNNTLRK